MASDNQPVKVWQPDYKPFMHGGDVHQPMACMITPDEVINLGKGIRIGVFNYPKGGRVVFEMTSGGVVGDHVGAVMKDFAKAEPRVMRQQIADAKEQGAKARMVSIEEFFAKRGKSK
jgi:hypothetical protein